ncbi:MAG: peptide ABC transporter substrate-binding protein [Sulfobacillus thermotolerans]|nr:peptide ABC transporter substrate-binding protein [Sulfobacillus thermotolerans]
MHKSASWRIAAIGLIGILASGCGATSSASHSATPANGGTAVIALAPQTSPNWFFPVRAVGYGSDVNMQLEGLMYKPLLDITPSDGINFAHSLVSSIDVSSNDTVFTLHLNSRYRWSNNAPITAQDVVFAWKIIETTSSSAPNLPWIHAGSGVGGVPTLWKSVVALNPQTVVVTLKSPSNPVWFEHNGLAPITPVPEAVWNKYPENFMQELGYIKSVANSPTAAPYHVVDGPYQFASMQANNDWVFVPNPHYGGHPSSLSKVIFQYETSPQAEFEGLKTGTITLGYLPSSLWSSRQELTHDVLNTAYLFGFDYLQPNLNPNAPGGLGVAFNQRYVREALEMGINQEGIIKAFYHGHGVVEDSPIPAKPPTKFYDSALSQPLYPYNPEQGKKLLEAHGWRLVNGVMTKGSTQLRFTLTYVSGSNTDADIVQLIKSTWAKEGIAVTLTPQPFDQIIAQANQTDPTKWNMVWWGGGWTYEPDFYPTGGGLFKSGSGANFGGYSSSEMNQLIAETYAPGSAAQSQSRLDAYQAWAAKDLPVLWMPWTPAFNVHAVNLHGTVKTFNPVSDLLSPNYWTLSQ